MFLGEILSLTFAITNMIIWVFVLIPQMYLNYVTKSTKALSILLLVYVFWGGVMSLISAILKSASMSIIYVGIHHNIMNIVFLSQVIYYRFIEKVDYTFNEKMSIIFVSINSLVAIFLTIFLQTSEEYRIILINMLAWNASSLFCISKLPQIYLNYKRRSVSGLSFTTFLTMLLTNICFLSSIFINMIDGATFISLFMLNIQWITSSLISMLADFIILYQFYYYNPSIQNNYQRINNEEEVFYDA
jgi:solute carrier family 66 (lysosomal lysine-arginine transporter), member 1